MIETSVPVMISRPVLDKLSVLMAGMVIKADAAIKIPPPVLIVRELRELLFVMFVPPRPREVPFASAFPDAAMVKAAVAPEVKLREVRYEFPAWITVSPKKVLSLIDRPLAPDNEAEVSVPMLTTTGFV